MENKPEGYKVVREGKAPEYFESRIDALDNADQGLIEARIVALYAGTDIPAESFLKEENEQLKTLVGLIRAYPNAPGAVTYQENNARCARFGCDDYNQLQWKWRQVETLPAEFDYAECEAAILDAFIRQGGATVWSGDGSGCATQIVQAVWMRMKAAEDKVKELENKLQGKQC